MNHSNIINPRIVKSGSRDQYGVLYITVSVMPISTKDRIYKYNKVKTQVLADNLYLINSICDKNNLIFEIYQNSFFIKEQDKIVGSGSIEPHNNHTNTLHNKFIITLIINLEYETVFLE